MFIILCIVIFVVCVIARARWKKSGKHPAPPPSAKAPSTAKITIKTEASSSMTQCEYFLAKGEHISVLDLGCGENPSGGYVNWSVYKVTGTNESTNRKNKRQYEAKDEAAAIAMAKKDGLLEPYEIQPLPHDAPTEKQIAYLLSWDTTVPDGATKYDVSAILSRLEGSEDVVSEKRVAKGKEICYIRPLPGPSAEFAKYADAAGVPFSRFVGGEVLFDNVVYSLDDRERAAFFAYCVLCSHYQHDIENLRSSPYADRLYEFADLTVKNAALTKSISERRPDDYRKPHKGTKAYKAVAEFFGLK